MNGVSEPFASNSCFSGSTVLALSKYVTIYRILLGRPLGRKKLERARRKWNDNIKMDFVEMGCEDVNLVQHIQGHGQQYCVTEHVEVYSSFMLNLPSKQRM
jgi:hypothetical protein